MYTRCGRANVGPPLCACGPLTILGTHCCRLSTTPIPHYSTQLFSECLQLPPFTGAMRSTTLSKRELSQLASVVHSRFQLLELDLTPWLDVLPDTWGHRLLQLRQGVRQELAQV
jgi:hypothetical protein